MSTLTTVWPSDQQTFTFPHPAAPAVIAAVYREGDQVQVRVNVAKRVVTFERGSDVVGELEVVVIG